MGDDSKLVNQFLVECESALRRHLTRNAVELVQWIDEFGTVRDALLSIHELDWKDQIPLKEAFLYGCTMGVHFLILELVYQMRGLDGTGLRDFSYENEIREMDFTEYHLATHYVFLYRGEVVQCTFKAGFRTFVDPMGRLHDLIHEIREWINLVQERLDENNYRPIGVKILHF